MELGKQIRKYRTDANLSQEELAEQVYVSRQTISNWENDKSYPDVKSLVLLSECFGVSLDIMVKGDLERMKKEIDEQERMSFQRDSKIFTMLFAAVVIFPLPLVKLWDWYGILAYLVLFAISLFYAAKIERYKKKYDMQTYKEILAFVDGTDLSEIEKAREGGKRMYQKTFLAVGAGLLTLLAAFAVVLLCKLFS